MMYQRVDNHSDLLREIISLADSERKTLGFFPQGAFEEYASKEQILAATDENGVLKGYLLYGIQRDGIRIIHLCVSKKYRREGIAAGLVNELLSQYKYTISSMYLSCRRDYGLNEFWRSLGFCPIGEKMGRAVTKETTLTKWILRNPGWSDLFTVEYQEDIRTKVVLDTNIVIDLYCRNNEETSALLEPFMTSRVKYYITEEVLNELNKNADSLVRNEHREFAKTKFEIITRKQFDPIINHEAMQDIIEKRQLRLGSNSDYDASHIACTIAAGIQVFITRDSAWLTEKIKEYLFDKYGLNILSPGELIKSIDEIASPNEYSPIKLSGLDYKYSEMSQMDMAGVSKAFFKPFHKKKDFDSQLRRWMAQPEKYSLRLVRDEDKIYAMAVCSKNGKIFIIHKLFVNDKVIKPSVYSTFVKRVVMRFVEQAKREQKNGILVENDMLTTAIREALKELLFVEQGSDFIRIIYRDVIEYGHESEIIENIDSLPSSLANYMRIPAEAPTKCVKLIQIEKTLWPCKVIGAGIPCFIVPIQPEYAIQLFDEDLANTNYSLFSNEQVEPALSIENVYYKSIRNTIKEYPARILWYVSYDDRKYGTMMIRASSYLDSIEKGTVSNLYRKYRRLGVLNWQDMLRFGSPDEMISAYRFSYTELFENPIALKEVQNILDKPVTFQSYVKITEDEFLRIYKRGVRYDP